MSFDLGSVAFSIASLSVLLLLLAQIRIWTTGKSSLVLLLATCVTLLWCLAMLILPETGYRGVYFLLLLESVKNAAWFALLLSVLGARRLVLRTVGDTSPIKGLALLTSVTLGVPALLFLYLAYLVVVGRPPANLSDYGGKSVMFGSLVAAIAGLGLLEQVIRNARTHLFWQIKFLCLGLGVLFTYDLYLYSDATLFARVDESLWQARGFVIAFATPLIALGVLRTRREPIQLNVSRRLVLHSGVLTVAGTYLLLMSAAGFYIRNIAGEWGGLLRVMFFTIALSLLVVVASSGRMRSMLRLYISRNLFSSKYDYREEWMRISQLLSAADSEDSLPERVVHVIANIVDSPSGGLWLSSDGNHYEQVAQIGMGWIPSAELKKTDDLIAHLSNSFEVVDLHENQDALARQSLPHWLRALPKAWLIVPLELQGRLVGFVLLTEARVQYRLNWEDHDMLAAAGRQTASYLAQMIASGELAEARQFSAFNQVSAFVVHDIKTLNSQLSMLVKNAERFRNNPAFIDDMIRTTEHAVKKMDILLKHFRKGNDAGEMKAKSLDLVGLVRGVIEAQAKQEPRPVLHCEAREMEVFAEESELKSAIGHLVQNAQDATPADGEVKLILEARGDMASLRVVDTGKGMTQEFIQTRLFSPFDSTKGLTGMGIGVYQSRTYVRKLGGNLVVRSEQGTGTEFVMTLPLADPARQAAT